ncbi:MAG: YfiR family protein [Vicinamibacteraceae bacterium]
MIPAGFRFARRAAVAAALVIATIAIPVRAGAPSEHQVKAAFLYNFANFVQWPEGALGPAGAPLKVCVVGTDPFGGALDDAFRDQMVQGRPVQVARGATLAAVGRCHILFLSQSEQGRWPDLLRELGTTPTLTVADAPLVRQGGMVSFVIEAKRVRFEINRGAAEHAGLRISSKLLALARIVESA